MTYLKTKLIEGTAEQGYYRYLQNTPSEHENERVHRSVSNDFVRIR